MKNFAKLFVVACGVVLAVSATSSSSKASDVSRVLPGEGCRGAGECGTTPGGVKLNGSYTVWPD